MPAFFSGCVTTTIDTVFPDLAAPPPAGAPVAYVDMPAEDVPAGAVTYAHSDPAVRRRSFVANAGRALDLLETYRTRHSAVVTSRLHCYLPLRSIGVPAEFRPRNRSDVRFDGLLDIDDEAFGAIRAGLLGKLEHVHEAILGGRPEAEVYSLWRELTAAEVAAAEERMRRPLRLPPVDAEVEQRLRRAVAKTVVRAAARAARPCTARSSCPRAAGATCGCSRPRSPSTRPGRCTSGCWRVPAPPGRAVSPRLVPDAGFSRVPIRGLGRVARLVLAGPAPGRRPRRRAAAALAGVRRRRRAGRHGSRAGIRGLRRCCPTGPAGSASSTPRRRACATGPRRRPSCAGPRMRATGSTSTRSPPTCSCSTSSACAARRSAPRRSPLVQQFGLREREVLHYLAGPGRATIPEDRAAAFTPRPDG